jgi:hypothetical protein
MSLRNGMLLLFGLSTLLFLGACGNSGTTQAVPPPSGGFSKSNLNGTYVFSVSGIDFVGAPFAMVGTFTANGNGGISGGTFDINDQDITVFPSPIADAAISGSSTYTLGVDGRGQANLITTTPFATITLDFVLSTSSHGLVTEFDNNATGSGTLDIQTAGITPTGTYAFSFSGFPFSSSTPYATVGNFTLTGTSAAGLEDFNEGGINVLVQQTLTGSVEVSNPPSTSLTFPSIDTLAFDVFPIDAGQLKFIEMDQFATLSGDAFSQTSTTVPTNATLAFTLEGASAVATPFAAGGFMVTDAAGNITVASTEDYNDDGNVSPTPSGNFTGTYAPLPSGSGRNEISFPSGSGFVGGTTYAAYPSTGGLLLLEIDNVGVMSGVASVQTSTAFSADGYALNLQGDFLSTGAEVDDIAEFVANTTGTTITGLLDENTDTNGIVATGAAFSSGVYTTPDAKGRGSISTNVGTSSSNTTLNGGFFLNFYSVDGTNFPFIETDSGQVAAGVFVLQNASAAAAAASAHSHVFVVHPLVQAHTTRTKKTGN